MAKFKVGDRVKIKIGGGMGAKVVKAHPVKPGFKETYDVVSDDGDTYTLSYEQIYSNAASNAKFKVGDKVKVKCVSPLREDFHSGIGTITKVMERGNGAGYHVSFTDGRELPYVESNLVSANSRACNEYGTRYIDEGDRVFVVSQKKKGIVKSFKTVKGPQPIISVRYDDGSVGVADAKDIRVIPNAANDADPYLSEKLKLMIRQGAVSEVAGGKPMPGDVVFEYRGKRYYTDKDSAHMVKQFSDAGLVKMQNSCGVRSTIPAVNAALNGGDDAIIRLCNPGNLVEASKTGSLHEVRYGAGFVYPLIGKDGVLVRVFRSLSEAHRSPLLNATARNAATDWEKVYQIKGIPVKLMWRGSPYNDLKATVEDGNRDLVPVARITASAPVSQAEAEKLCAPVWRKIRATARNARPLGKGEILRRGDYVETPWDGEIGRVVGVKILDRDNGSAVYKVKMEKTGTFFDFPGHHLKVV